MTPRRALLLSFLPLLVAAARAEGPGDPRPAAARAFLAGRPVFSALAPGQALSDDMAGVFRAADEVQKGGAPGQGDAEYRAAVLASADAFGVKDPEARKTVLELYLARRASGARAPAAAPAAAPDEAAALDRAARLRARVSATKNPFAAAVDPGGADPGSRAPSALKTAPGAASPATPGADPLVVPPGQVGARIAEALSARRAELPADFKRGPGAVPSLVMGKDGQVTTVGAGADPPANPDLPALKWNSPLLRPDKFTTGYKQDEGKPQSAADIARIEKTFHYTIARLVREGRRLEGTGNGIENNVWAKFRAKDGARCYEQSEALMEDLAKEFHSSNSVGEFVEPRGRWLFKMTTYFGEGHEADGHYWVTAISREPGDPTLILDPWKGTIVRSPEKNPVVTKGYGAYWLGYVLSKTIGQ